MDNDYWAELEIAVGKLFSTWFTDRVTLEHATISNAAAKNKIVFFIFSPLKKWNATNCRCAIERHIRLGIKTIKSRKELKMGFLQPTVKKSNTEICPG